MSKDTMWHAQCSLWHVCALMCASWISSCVNTLPGIEGFPPDLHIGCDIPNPSL